MSAQIQFRAGQFQVLTATRTFDLGNTGMKVPRGAELEFDGTRVNFEGFNGVMPQLRGAVKMGWLEPAASYNPNALPQRPVSAGIQVRSAEGGNPMQQPTRRVIGTDNVESEEREVRNVQAHARETQQRNATNYRREGGEVVRNNRGQMEVIEDQEGVAVRGLKTPAKQQTNLEKTSPQEAIRQADAVRIDPGQGRSREDMMADMDEESRAAYEAEIEARKAAYALPDESPTIVGRVKPQQRQQRTEGFIVNSSIGGGVDTADLGGTGGAGKDQVTQVEMEGVRFTNTNGPKKNVRLVPANQAPAAAPVNGAHDAMCRQIAKQICQDFPDNYVFSDPVRKKIARLQADFDDRPDVILAVAAADTDPEVRSRLMQEFPQAFGG